LNAVLPCEFAPYLPRDSAANACGRRGKNAADPFAGSFFAWMLAYFSLGDKLHNGSDEPLRPSCVGSNELCIYEDQEFQFFTIRYSARKMVPLKAADITIADLALSGDVTDKFLKLCVNHC